MSRYTRESVERLLPGVWDMHMFLSESKEYAPAGDMPRARIDPATTGNVLATLCDVKTAWEKAPLSEYERKAVLLHYGIGMRDSDVAKILGIATSYANTLRKRGAQRIADTLNGEYAGDKRFKH